MAQNSSVRPWLENACAQIRCRLPDYRRPEDIEIIERGLYTQDEGAIQFHLVMVNSGRFPLSFPELRLTLVRFNGDPLGYRIFRPEEYLPDSDKLANMPVGELFEINLMIANPETGIGGYTFSFI